MGIERLKQIGEARQVLADEFAKEVKATYPVGTLIRFNKTHKSVVIGEVLYYTGFGACTGVMVRNIDTGRTYRYDINPCEPPEVEHYEC